MKERKNKRKRYTECWLAGELQVHELGRMTKKQNDRSWWMESEGGELTKESKKERKYEKSMRGTDVPLSGSQLLGR